MLVNKHKMPNEDAAKILGDVFKATGVRDELTLGSIPKCLLEIPKVFPLTEGEAKELGGLAKSVSAASSDRNQLMHGEANNLFVGAQGGIWLWETFLQNYALVLFGLSNARRILDAIVLPQ